MLNWKNNTLMVWVGLNGSGVSTTYKVSDHSREPVDISTERYGTDERMANGTLRRFHIKSNRTWSLSWKDLPSIAGPAGYIKPIDGGMSGRAMEDFYYNNPGRFRIVVRSGSASGKTIPPVALIPGAPYKDADFYGVDVMMTEFSHTVSKRGVVDLWSVDITLEEV